MSYQERTSTSSTAIVHGSFQKFWLTLPFGYCRILSLRPLPLHVLLRLLLETLFSVHNDAATKLRATTLRISLGVSSVSSLCLKERLITAARDG